MLRIFYLLNPQALRSGKRLNLVMQRAGSICFSCIFSFFSAALFAQPTSSSFAIPKPLEQGSIVSFDTGCEGRQETSVDTPWQPLRLGDKLNGGHELRCNEGFVVTIRLPGNGVTRVVKFPQQNSRGTFIVPNAPSSAPEPIKNLGGRVASFLDPELKLGSRVTEAAFPSYKNPITNTRSVSEDETNAVADAAAYKELDYTNRIVRGAALVVIPGEIKNANAAFKERFSPNVIADLAEIELAQANFSVLERSDLGSQLDEISLAYDLGDRAAAIRNLQVGKLKSTKWVVKFDVLKAEQIDESKKSFDGRAIGGLTSGFGRPFGAGPARVPGSINTKDSTGLWHVGVRYKIIDANTAEQIAQGYKEIEMTSDENSTSILGNSATSKRKGGLLEVVHRLVQSAVWDIDAKYK